MSRILSLRDVKRTYGEPPVAACAGISLDVDRGEFIAVVGPSGSGESKERVIPITVTLTDASATTNFQEVSVTVDLPSEKRTGVLSVPVGALLALSADQYGVEIVEAGGTTRKVPVTIGLFAGGRVEISGKDISEGQRVVVPQT